MYMHFNTQQLEFSRCMDSTLGEDVKDGADRQKKKEKESIHKVLPCLQKQHLLCHAMPEHGHLERGFATL